MISDVRLYCKNYKGFTKQEYITYLILLLIFYVISILAGVYFIANYHFLKLEYLPDYLYFYILILHIVSTIIYLVIVAHRMKYLNISICKIDQACIPFYNLYFLYSLINKR